MRKIALYLSAITAASLLFAACGKGGGKSAVALSATYVYKMPGTTKAAWGKNRNYSAFIKRGESLAILKKHKDMDDWYQVQLSDGETKGWIHTKYIFIGEKAPITFTKGGKWYSRPDDASPSGKILPGDTGLILKRLKNGWVKVNFAYKGKKYKYKGLTHWVREDSFERGTVDVKPEDAVETVSTGVGTAKVSASSVLKEAAGYTYHAKNAFDGNLATTWQEGKPGSGIGEWIEIKFNSSIMVNIEMVNGFAHSDAKYGDLYEANNRVKRIRISYGDNLETSVNVDLVDSVPSFQPVARGLVGSRFRITILEVYKGSKWQDTAISEIRFTPASGRGAPGGDVP